MPKIFKDFTVMEKWDTWREMFEEIPGASLPRESFESYIDDVSDQAKGLRKLFDSIVCLAVEGPEVDGSFKTLQAIISEAAKGIVASDKLIKDTDTNR